MKMTAVVSKLLCLMSVCGLTACQFSKNSSNSIQLSDSVKTYDPYELAEITKSQRLSLSQRLTSLEHLKKSFSYSYYGYDLKKHLIGMSGEEVFAACLENEKAFPDPIPTFQFYDGLNKCLAMFQDSHLNLRRHLSTGKIATIIASAYWVKNQMYIASVRKKLASKIEEIQNLQPGTISDLIQVGSKIISINGQSPQKAVDEMKVYTSSSSPAARLEEATENLFARNFLYPETNTLEIEIENANGKTEKVFLPWVIRGGLSLESSVHLQQKEFSFENKIDGSGELMKSSGYYVGDSIFQKQLGKVSYFDDRNQEAIATGHIELTLNQQLQKVCYLSIYTFDVGPSEEAEYTVFLKDGTNKVTKDLYKIAQDFSKDCEQAGYPLILDLRNNGGGDNTLSAKIFQLFSKAEGPQLFEAKSMVASQGNLPVISELIDSVVGLKPSVQDKLYYLAVKESLQQGSRQTNWMVRRVSNATTDVFNGPLFVLISPQCISACDNIANRFHLAKRGLLIGTATNGTGFGYISSLSNATSVLDPANLFKMSIPNQAFTGVMISDSSQFESDHFIIGGIQPFETIPLLENAPTRPEISYSLTVGDLRNYEDYQKFLTELIENKALHK